MTALISLADKLVAALTIRRIKNDKVRNLSHKSNILKWHMGSTVNLCSDSRVCTYEVDTLLGIVNREEELVICSS